MSDPIFDGLAEGLAPSRDIIPVRDAALLAMNAKLDRIAEATERQAAAMEAVVALFASCIGAATAWCPGEPETLPTVHYFRSGTGGTFRCDAARDNEDDDN